LPSGVNGRKSCPYWTPGNWIGSKWNDYRRSARDFPQINGGNLAVSSRTGWRNLAAVSNLIFCGCISADESPAKIVELPFVK
jgi:hypothetical protein